MDTHESIRDAAMKLRVDNTPSQDQIVCHSSQLIGWGGQVNPLGAGIALDNTASSGTDLLSPLSCNIAHPGNETTHHPLVTGNTVAHPGHLNLTHQNSVPICTTNGTENQPASLFHNGSLYIIYEGFPGAQPVYPGLPSLPCQHCISVLSCLSPHVRVLKKRRRKEHKCQICGKVLSSGRSLKEHSRIHTGRRPFACKEPGCGMYFKWRSSLAGHKGKHGQEEHSIVSTRKVTSVVQDTTEEVGIDFADSANTQNSLQSEAMDSPLHLLSEVNHIAVIPKFEAEHPLTSEFNKICEEIDNNRGLPMFESSTE